MPVAIGEIHPEGSRVDILELFDDQLPGNHLTAVFKGNRVREQQPEGPHCDNCLQNIEDASARRLWGELGRQDRNHGDAENLKKNHHDRTDLQQGPWFRARIVEGESRDYYRSTNFAEVLGDFCVGPRGGYELVPPGTSEQLISAEPIGGLGD